jgi:hypothetical protein
MSDFFTSEKQDARRQFPREELILVRFPEQINVGALQTKLLTGGDESSFVRTGRI